MVECIILPDTCNLTYYPQKDTKKPSLDVYAASLEMRAEFDKRLKSQTDSHTHNIPLYEDCILF